MQKKVTLDDIAARAGVSKNTVSVVLRGKSGVSETMRRKILDIAADMNYTRGTAGRCRYVMALLSDSITNHIAAGVSGLIPRIYFALQSACQKNDCIMIPYSLTSDMVKNDVLPPMLQEVEFLGIVTIGHMEPDYVRLLKASGQHVVMAHEYIDSMKVDAVISDDCYAGYFMTRYLIELGHRDIAYFGEKYYMAKYMDRWQGYCRAMAEFDLPITLNSYSERITDRQINEDELNYLNKAFDEMERLPTAIVCGEDYTATRVRSVLEKRGIRFPEDMSLVGFDDVYYQESDLKITTYRVDHETLVNNIMNLLMNPFDEPRRITVFGSPVYRESAIKMKA